MTHAFSNFFVWREFLIAIQRLLVGVSICLMLLSHAGLQPVRSPVTLAVMGCVGAALTGLRWHGPCVIARQAWHLPKTTQSGLLHA